MCTPRHPGLLKYIGKIYEQFLWSTTHLAYSPTEVAEMLRKSSTSSNYHMIKYCYKK